MRHTKTCDRCGVAKPTTEKYFDTNLRSPDRLKTYCRACSPTVTAERRARKREKAREWAAANREKVRESVKRAYENNRAQRLAYMRRWRQENKEHIADYQRAYKEKIKHAS
jgi:hypothetical protein